MNNVRNQILVASLSTLLCQNKCISNGANSNGKPNMFKLHEVERQLGLIGYEEIVAARQITPNRKIFFTERDRQRYHVHLCIFEGSDWFEMLNVKAVLSQNKDYREQYSKAKKIAAKKYPNKPLMYNLEKYHKYKQIKETAMRSQ